MSGSRVLLFSHHFPTPDQPGAARPWEFAEALADSYDVTVVASATDYMESGFDADADGLWSCRNQTKFNVVRLKSVGGYRGGLVARLADYALYSLLALVYAVQDTEADAVVAGTPPPFHLPVVSFISLVTGQQFVLDVRDLYPETAVALDVVDNRVVEWAYRWYERWFWRRADALTVPSEPMVDVLSEAGVPRKRVHVVHNAYSSVTTESNGPEAGVPKWANEFVVVYAGGMGHAPDIPTILDAAKRLRDRNVRFVFLGDGERKASYERRCEREGLDNCEFLPPVPRREVGAYLDQADACVHALPDHEVWTLALPNKVFDYMRNKNPVVFAGRGASANLIEKANCGITVPPGDDASLADAIEELSTRPEITADMATAAEIYMSETYPRQRLVNAVGSAVA